MGWQDRATDKAQFPGIHILVVVVATEGGSWCLATWLRLAGLGAGEGWGPGAAFSMAMTLALRLLRQGRVKLRQTKGRVS